MKKSKLTILTSFLMAVLLLFSSVVPAYADSYRIEPAASAAYPFSCAKDSHVVITMQSEGSWSISLTADASTESYYQETVAFTAGQPKIVELDLKAGSYILTAKNESAVQTAMDISSTITPYGVDSITNLTLSQNTLSMLVGETFDLSYQTEPVNITLADVQWSSSDPSVADVAGSSKSEPVGTITAKKPGTAVITASVGAYSAQCNVTITEDSFSYKLNLSKKSLYLKDKVTLSVSGTADKVTWKSSNTSVATVNASGVVTAKAKGSCTITATVNGIKLTCAIKVYNPSISQKKGTVYIGSDPLALSVKGTTGTVKWASSNKKIAKVSSKGKVTGVKKGTATITATVGGVKYSCKVTVKNPKVVAKGYYPSNGRYYYGVEFSDGFFITCDTGLDYSFILNTYDCALIGCDYRECGLPPQKPVMKAQRTSSKHTYSRVSYKTYTKGLSSYRKRYYQEMDFDEIFKTTKTADFISGYAYFDSVSLMDSIVFYDGLHYCTLYTK